MSVLEEAAIGVVAIPMVPLLPRLENAGVHGAALEHGSVVVMVELRLLTRSKRATLMTSAE